MLLRVISFNVIKKKFLFTDHANCLNIKTILYYRTMHILSNDLKLIHSLIAAVVVREVESYLHRCPTTKMAAASDPDEVLRSTTGKANFQRLARLLISGGATLPREIFDQICPPSNLPTILKNPATVKNLKAARLTKPQWDCLYPYPGVYGKSADFDVTLLFRLLRTICNLTPPVTGWELLPASTDHSLEADLARVKYYRNSVYGHVNQRMEIADDFEFLSLWQEISGALVRIAGQISPTKKREWQEAIDNFLKDPLTTEDERNVQELLEWYRNDMEVKISIQELKVASEETMGDIKRSLKDALGVFEENARHTIQVIEEKVGGLETAVREEAQLTKDELGELRQLINIMAPHQAALNQMQVS